MSSETRDICESPESSTETKQNLMEESQGGASKSKCQKSNTTRSFDLGIAMTGSVNNEDVQKILSIQIKSLKNFARTNELLGKFNDYSSSKYDVLHHMFLQHTRLLIDLKKNLTNVFLRIRRLKVKLQRRYPEAFEATFNLRQDLEDRLEQEDASQPTYVSNTKEKSMQENKVTVAIGNSNVSEEINNDLNPEHDKMNTCIQDKSEASEILESCDSDDSIYEDACIGNEKELEDERLSEVAYKKENNENLKAGNEYVAQESKKIEMVDGDLNYHQVITGDTEDFQGITRDTEDCRGNTEDARDCQVVENSNEIGNTSDSCNHGISEDTNDHQEIKGGLQVTVIDNEGTSRISQDVNYCQDIQSAPDYAHGSEASIEDPSKLMCRKTS